MTKYKKGTNQYKKVIVRDWRGSVQKISLHQTRFQRLVSWIKKILTLSMLGTMAVLAVYGFFMYKYQTPKAVAEDKETAVLVDKIEAMKDQVVGDVAVKCESKGLTAKDAPMILDTNKQMSLGIYMFQVKTVQHYYKTLYGQTITRQEATQIAFDEKKAHELAKRIMFETSNKANDWLNCAKILGTNQQIALIKSLE